MTYSPHNLLDPATVIFLPEVHEYLEDLAIFLYKHDYFGYYDDALQYVDDLVFDIEKNLPTKVKRRAPLVFRKYGINLEFASFSKNRRTTWYVFFDRYIENGNQIFLVKHIENNHTAAKYMLTL
jgi:hypothetical protein